MKLTYEDIQLAIRQAADIHRLNGDVLLTGAIERLVPYLSKFDDEYIELHPLAEYCYNAIQRAYEAKVTLYGE